MSFELHLLGKIPVSLFASVVVLLSLLRKWLSVAARTKQKEPQLPGPRGIPWAGPLWSVDPQHMWLSFGKWAKSYGPIYKVQLFGVNFVIISHPDIAKEILAKQGAVCSDRPDIANIPGSKSYGEYLPFLGHNDVMRRQRKFGTMVNSSAFKARYHGHIVTEIQRLLVNLSQSSESYDATVQQAFARISCRLAWDTPEPATAVIANAHNLMKNLSPAGRTTNILTFLRHLPSFLSHEKQHEERRHTDEHRLWKGLLEHAEERNTAGTLGPCYAKYYFDGTGASELNPHEAIYGVGMMATVAIITLSAPIGWFVVAMAKFPQWQKAAQDEIDRVCGLRMPDLNDMPMMPLVRAVINETLRWHGTVPTGIPHLLEKDILWNGYTIKQGTSVMACDWAMSRNPLVYDEPDTFNPDRWINSAYSTFRAPLTEFPKVHGQHGFGFGRRTCIGQDHVAAVLFSTFSAILWAFNLRPQVDTYGRAIPVKVETETPHVIPLPAAQKITFTTRSRVKAESIAQFS